MAATPSSQKERKATAAGPLDELVAATDREVAAHPSAEAVEYRAAEGELRAQQDHIVFLLGRTNYGVEIGDVVEMGRVPPITRLPNVPDFVLGVANLRGEVLPVLDLRHLLESEHAELKESSRILVARLDRGDARAALVVDAVMGLAAMGAERPSETSGSIPEQVHSLLRGTYEYRDQLLNVLDLRKLASAPELEQLSEI